MRATEALGRAIANQGQAAPTLFRGVVVVLDPATGALGVNISGVPLPARWPAGWTPAVGDQVRGIAADGERVVLARLGPAPTGPIGTAAPLAPPTPTPPPGPPASGTSRYPAIDSGYFSTVDGWAGSASYGSRLMQGTSTGTNTGAWFYGQAPAELQGRTITAARVRIIRTPDYGPADPAPAHLYAHLSPARPAGPVALGPAAGDAVLARGAADSFPITVAAAQAVIAGGGLAITGGPHLVLEGIRERSDSGLLEIDWRR